MRLLIFFPSTVSLVAEMQISDNYKLQIPFILVLPHEKGLTVVTFSSIFFIKYVVHWTSYPFISALNTLNSIVQNLKFHFVWFFSQIISFNHVKKNNIFFLNNYKNRFRRKKIITFIYMPNILQKLSNENSTSILFLKYKYDNKWVIKQYNMYHNS